MANSSIKAGVFQHSYTQREWIYRNEYELLFISEGTGQRIVGDRIDSFKPGDLIFLGRMLPNIWVSDPIKVDPRSDRCVESIFIRFSHELLMGQLFSKPEFGSIRNAIHRSEQGCEIIGDARNKISELMMKVPYIGGFEQIVNLLNILNIIGSSNEINFLVSPQYPQTRQFRYSKRVQILQEYLMRNYQKPLQLEVLAQLLHMQSASLCRFFKRETNMTISEYLNRLRIDLASKMLMNEQLMVEEIAYDCGFNTISFFNRQFKKYTFYSPSEYRKVHYSFSNGNIL